MQKIQLLVLLFVTLVVTGCGGQKGMPVNYVEGMITLDGQPLENASVTFSPVVPDGKTAMGVTDEAGKYRLTSSGGDLEAGAPAGEYIVIISKVEMKPRPGSAAARVAAGLLSAENSMLIGSSDYVQTNITPKIYMDQSTTPLKATVKKGKNDIPFDLKTK